MRAVGNKQQSIGKDNHAKKHFSNSEGFTGFKK